MHNAADRPNRLDGLDGLRGIAILLVIIWHYFIDLPVTGSQVQVLAVVLLSWTWAGVDLFFVLSGFLIARNLLMAPPSRDLVVTFYVRRLARLVPLYIVVLFGFVVARSIYADSHAANIGRLLGKEAAGLTIDYQLFLQNIGIAMRGLWPGQWLAPTWSLAVEVQFYLVAPIVLLLAPRRSLPAVLLTIAAGALMLRCAILLATGVTMPAHLLFPCRADAFALGALVAHLSLDARYQARLAATATLARRYSWFGLLVLLSSGTFGFVLYAPETATIGYSMLALIAAAMLLIALYSPMGWWHEILTTPVLRFFGTHSFGIYLLHQPVRGLLAIALAEPGYVTATSPSLSLLALAVTMVLAALSWHWLEVPIIDMSRRKPIPTPPGHPNAPYSEKMPSSRG